MAQSQVFSITEDCDGFVWFGTRGGGLSRFDGIDFRVFNESDGLISNYLWSGAVTRNERLWFGTDKGLVEYKNNRFVHHSEVFENESVTALLSFGDSLIIGSTDGLGVLYKGEFKEIEIPFKGLISSLEVVNNHLYVGSDLGLNVVDLDKMSISSIQELHDVKVRAIQQVDSTIFVGTYGRGVLIIHDDTAEWINDLLGIQDARVHAIEVAENDIWFATQLSGVIRFNRTDSTVERITEIQGLSNNHVRSLCQDSWGNVWIGTSGGGVSQYLGQTFDYYTDKNGLTGNYIYSLTQDCNGAIWVSTSNHGISIIDDANIDAFELPKTMPKGKVRVMLHTYDSLLVLGFDGLGVAIVEKDTVSFFSTQNGLKSNYIRDVIEDGYGNLWIATAGGGITALYPDTNGWAVKTLGKDDGLPSDRVNKLMLDDENRIWFATLAGGAGYIKDDTVAQIWNRDRGLTDNNINALFNQSNGKIWLGTARSGLMVLTIDKDSFTLDTLSVQNGLVSNICYQLVGDENENLWVGSEKGVQRLEIGGDCEIINHHFYGFDEGFQGVETTQNAVLKSQYGELWFGTINGLCKFVGHNENRKLHYPKLRFTYIAINNSQYQNLADTFRLTYDSNMVTIGFDAVSQFKAKNINYRHRLIGLNEDWSKSSKNKEVNYAGLQPGVYEFQVQSSLDHQNWTDVKSIHFQINSPFWTRLWFLVLVAATIIMFILSLVWLRIRQLKHRSRLREQRLRVEKEMLELEQKALRLQMNPHFIFNALNSIQAMISKNDSKTARYYLAKFSKLMRQVLDNSRQPQVSLSREIETLENYLSIERFCHENRFDYEIICPDTVEKDDIFIPPIILQPFVENSIVHGVSKLEKDGYIKIRFRHINNTLECVINDNGIGREAASKLKDQTEQRHKSTALLITQERLDQLNQNSFDSSITIVDLMDAGKAKGTEVTIRILLNTR